jgi:hypothetical protein
MFAKDKHSSLLWKIRKLRTKKFYNIGPWSVSNILKIEHIYIAELIKMLMKSH